jgi:hypothetical protein
MHSSLFAIPESNPGDVLSKLIELSRREPIIDVNNTYSGPCAVRHCCTDTVVLILTSVLAHDYK